MALGIPVEMGRVDKGVLEEEHGQSPGTSGNRAPWGITGQDTRTLPGLCEEREQEQAEKPGQCGEEVGN